MPPDRLENLVRSGALIPEPPHEAELDRMLASATARLADAGRTDISYDSRFDLAYNAAHAFALVALRRRRYRPRNRTIVFQLLEETAGLPAERWRILDVAHTRRNVAEYEGGLDEDLQLLDDLLAVTHELRDQLQR